MEKEEQEIIDNNLKNIVGHAKNIIDWIQGTEWHPSKNHAKDIIKWCDNLKKELKIE